MFRSVDCARRTRVQGGVATRRPRDEPLRAAFARFAVPIALHLSAFLALADEPDPAADLVAVERAFKTVAERVAPSVVSIRVERRLLSGLTDRDQAAGSGLSEQLVIVNGAGTLLSPEGLILTNEHVVQSATTVDVILWDGDRRPGQVVAADPRSDLAIIRIDRKDLPVAALCDWTSVARGQWALVLGNPYGLAGDGHASVSIGVISNLGRRLPGLGEIDDRFYGNMIQTTAAINPGNSGGPLFNLRGEVVGVITAMHARSGQTDGIGFAVAMTPTKRLLIERLMRGEQIEYGFAGLSVRELESTERQSAEVPEGVGVVAARVEADGPAVLAGIHEGDVITEYDGLPVTGVAELVEMVGLSKVGAKIALHMKRGAHPSTTELTIARRDVSRVAWLRGDAILWRGMRLTDLGSAAREKQGLQSPAGGVVVVEVSVGSPAGRAGVQIGNVIERIAGTVVLDVAGFREHAQAESGPVQILVRGAGTRTIEP